MSDPYEPHVRVVRWWLLAIAGSLAAVVIPGLAIWAATSLWPILFWCCCGMDSQCQICPAGGVPETLDVNVSGVEATAGACPDGSCESADGLYTLTYIGICSYRWIGGVECGISGIQVDLIYHSEVPTYIGAVTIESQNSLAVEGWSGEVDLGASPSCLPSFTPTMTTLVSTPVVCDFSSATIDVN